MSEKQIANFEKAGITVIADADASKTLTGRSIVKEIEFDGQKIATADFKNAINNMPEFRNALYRAYNPIYPF
jgi:formate-dependent phosphoribosylglycinamide formyltransferase (GAR transformylase)